MMLQMSPLKYAGFAFAWLELISHYLFMPHFLKPTQQMHLQSPQQMMGQQQAMFANNVLSGSGNMFQGNSEQL